MKNKALFGVAVFTGTAVGSLVAMVLIDFSLEIFFMAFFALIGIMTMAVLTIALINDVRNEDRKNQRINRPANWGFDKRFE